MAEEPGFGRFVALSPEDAPQLLQRMGTAELPVDGERYGVFSRLLARPRTTSVQLAVATLEKLARETGLPVAAWGGLVLSSRIERIEQAAGEVARRIGLSGPACGMERACSGFPAATELAVDLARREQRPIALVAAETISQNINWEAADGNLADQQRARGQASKLFADGAAAVLVHPGGPRVHRILDAWAGEVPDEKQLIQKLDVLDSQDPWGQVRPGVTTCLSMPGRRGFLLLRRAPQVMADAVAISLQRAGIDGSELSHVVPHQANGLIMDALQELVRQRFHARCRVWNCFQTDGNTVSASIPLAMAQVQQQLPPGCLVALPSVGAGGPGYRPDVLSHGCILVRSGAGQP